MNKKITLSLLLALLSCFSFAQQTSNTEFKNSTLQVFQNLDKSKVPYGILLDYGMEFTNIQAFDGVLRDTTITDSQTITDVYKTLLMSRVTESSTGFITPREYTNRWYSQRQTGVVTLSGLYFKYSKFNDNAYPNKLNFTNNQFSDKFVGGVWQNPYDVKSMFVMAPAVNSYKNLNFQVKLPSNIFLTNDQASIQNIQIDFADGLGFRAVTSNQLVSVSYTVADLYTWQYKITLTNGQTLLSHSKVAIGDPSLRDCPICNVPIYSKSVNSTSGSSISGYPKVTITATTPYNGQYGSATLYIRYANGGSTIRKPLIVAEGFDTGVILTPEQEGGDYNINTFLKRVNDSGSNLPYALSSYDIIFVDWNNGVDFIQKNAYVLEEVIKYVNAQKVIASSTTPNVVMGQSMGGLVARYALRDIELNRNFNHDTNLYISHDTPHLGANTPLSVQYALRHIRNIYVSSPIAVITGEGDIPVIVNLANGIIEAINNNNWGSINELDYVTPLTAFSVSDTPAARQMQLNWINRNYELKNGIHDLWQQELTTMGYPQGYAGKPIRNIAIANGSECGTLQPDNGNIVSYIKQAGKNTALSNYIGILDGVYGTFLSRPDIVTVGLMPGKSYWDIDFQSKYMTTLNESKIIYHGSIKYKKKVLWFIPVSITVTDKNVSQPANILPYDIYGGGRQQTSTSQLVLDGITSNSFGFIPTASALDIGKGSTALNDADYRKSYVGALTPSAPKDTPFQNFVTSFNKSNPASGNALHITFDERNGNWLSTELAALSNTAIVPAKANCSFICSDTQITGEGTLCNTGIYSVPNSAQSYNWFITQGADLVSLTGSNTNAVTLKLLNPKSTGTVILSLYISTSDCGSNTLTKSISVGNIPPISSIQGPQICENQTATYTIPGTCASVPAIQWTTSSNLSILSTSGYSVTVKEISGTAGHASLTATFLSDGSQMSTNLTIGDDTDFGATKTVYDNPTDLYGNFVFGSNLIFDMFITPHNSDSEYSFSNFKINGVPVTISVTKKNRLMYTFRVPRTLANDVECPLIEYTLTCKSRCNVTRTITGKVPITCAGFIEADPLEPIFPLAGKIASSDESSYKVYPNPSNNLLNIALIDGKAAAKTNSVINAELYNMKGELKTSTIIRNNIATLNVSGLPIGVYVLKINIDGVVESHQVLIN